MTDVNSNAPQKMRNARACEACRASKSRCFFKPNEQKVCQRCEQIGSQCIIRSKARPMRSRATRPLSGCGRPLSPRDSEFSIDLPSVAITDGLKDVQDLQDHHRHVLENEEESTSLIVDGDPRLLEQRKLDLKQAEQLLLSFRQKAPFFPFVLVPTDVTVPSLSRTSPFLLLSILTTAADDDPLLRHQLDQEFRRILSTRVIVAGQKSLDFLQGLLVYISWYPLHCKPKTSQAFLYVSLAIGLAVDLGIDKEVPGSNDFNTINTVGLIENGQFTQAAKRAYLGCYFISSVLSLGFQKPNNMQYRNLMDENGESIVRAEPSSDITSMILLQRLSEKIAMVDIQRQEETDDPNPELTSEINVQIFQNELQVWRMNALPEVKTLPHIVLAERSAAISIYSYELGFLRRPYRNDVRNIASSALPSHLTACLTACKSFFEYLLSIPEALLAHLSTLQRSLMIQAILVLSRLTFIMALTMSWDPDTTRANIPLSMYLDALCYRFQALSSTTPSGPNDPPPKNPDVLYVFKMMMGSVKKSYERRVSKIQPNVVEVYSAHIVKGHCPITDPSLSVYFDNGFDELGNWGSGDWTTAANTSGTASTPSSSAAAYAPLYHDLWATMTGSWAEEI